MKILHIVPTYIPAWRYGGPIRSVHELAVGQVELGHSVDVFTTSIDGPSNSNVVLGEACNLDGVNVWYFESYIMRRLYWSFTMMRSIKKRIMNYDLVHLHSVFLWPTLAGARAAQKANIPYIVSPRGMLVKELVKKKSFFIKMAWFTLFEKRTLEKAVAVHVTSKIEKNELIKFKVNIQHIFIVPNGVNLPARQLNNKAVVEPYVENNELILFLGRVSWEKGLERLIQALCYTCKGDLCIAGNYTLVYKTELEKLISHYGLKDRVIFAGQVLGEEKERLFEKASVLVLPSYSENFGNVVLEAMAHETPVIVTPGVGLADAVKKSGAGIVCSGSPEELGKSIDELLSDRRMSMQMGQCGRAVVEKQFSRQVVAQNMVAQYRAVC